MADVTPIKQTPLNDLNQVVELCVCYGDEQHVAASSAQQQLPRIRGLVMRALAKLSEPHASTIEAVQVMVNGKDFSLGMVNPRWARDAAAIVTHHALTWGVGNDLDSEEP